MSNGQPLQAAKTTGVGAAPICWVNWANLAAYVINLIITYVSITGVFGATNSELSNKYQTLLTPSGFAFSIWGLIFIWEGIFAVTQMLPKFRGMPIVRSIGPFWWSICFFQVGWSLVFAQEWITVALVFMLALLAGLLGLLSRANSMSCESILEFWLLRAPFSLHAGWILAASVLNANVQADYARASPAVLLALTIVSLAVIFTVSSLFTFAAVQPDSIIPLVVSWALFAVSAELKEAAKLLDPAKHNPVAWDRMILDAVETAASILSLACLGLAVVGAALRIYRSGIGATLAHAPSNEEQQSAVP